MNTQQIDLWHYELQALAQGHKIVAGVDEAGRGPLAGPVVASAVVLPKDADIEGIFDSKQLTPKKRDAAFDKIHEIALGIGVGIVDARTIDQINILQATYRAMKSAIAALHSPADIVLVDGYPIRGFALPQVGIIGGDSKSVSIAAASIIAKVTRDRMMCDYDRLYPQYGFSKHKGYPTPDHIRAITEYGVCEIHRKTFSPIKELNPTWEQTRLL